jgi:hypothetical protein
MNHSHIPLGLEGEDSTYFQAKRQDNFIEKITRRVILRIGGLVREAHHAPISMRMVSSLDLSGSLFFEIVVFNLRQERLIANLELFGSPGLVPFRVVQH